MTILVLEDEEPAARQLTQQLVQLGVVAAPLVVRSVEKALLWLQANPMPDLILSDIELLDGNVFILYERFRVTCPIIFITAYDQFLLPAFQGNGIAYLLKPFTSEQLQAALDKYEQLRCNFADSATPGSVSLSPQVVRELGQALRQSTQPTYKQRFPVRLRNGIHLLPVADIAYLQADEGVVFAIDKIGGRYPLNGTLTELERQLDPAAFGRLNRSELVNIAFIERLEPYFNNRVAVKLRDQQVTLITSAAQTPEFWRWLEG